MAETKTDYNEVPVAGTELRLATWLQGEHLFFEIRRPPFDEPRDKEIRLRLSQREIDVLADFMEHRGADEQARELLYSLNDAILITAGIARKVEEIGRVMAPWSPAPREAAHNAAAELDALRRRVEELEREREQLERDLRAAQTYDREDLL